MLSFCPVSLNGDLHFQSSCARGTPTKVTPTNWGTGRGDAWEAAVAVASGSRGQDKAVS